MYIKKILWVCLIALILPACSSYRIPLIGSSGETITVKKGMTLYAISRQTNVPVRTLIEANNLKPPYALSIGQKIKVPKAKIHVVKKSETLYSISKRYGLTVSALSRQNNIQPPYTLSIGQKLINGFLYAEGKTRVKDDITGKTRTAILRIPRLKLVSDLSMRLGREANPLLANFAAVGYPASNGRDKKVMELLFLSDDIDAEM